MFLIIIFFIFYFIKKNENKNNLKTNKYILINYLKYF